MAEAPGASVEGDAEVWRCELTRRFGAPLAQVWRAFADPARVAMWFGPEGLTSTVESYDFRPGGAYRLVMRAEDGREFPLEGRFVEIEEGRRLVMTWLWLMPEATGIETLVSIDFRPDGAGTELRLAHERFADADNAAGHGEGWESSLRCLDAYLVESGDG